MSPLKKFFVHYSHFFTGNALTLMLSLVSFPILTRLLSTEEYGILGLMTSTMMLAIALAKAGLSDGIVRFFKEYSQSDEQIARFSSTIVVRGLLLAAVVAGAYLLFFPFAARALGIDSRYLGAFMLMAAYILVRPLNISILNVMRVSGLTVRYNVVNFLDKLASIVLSLALFFFVVKGLQGFFLGMVAAEFLVAIGLFAWFIRHYEISPRMASGAVAGRLMAFGAPLLITELAYLLLAYTDRYMIMAYYDEAALGVYSVGYNLASYIGDLIMFSLSYAVIPIYVAIHQTEGREKTEEFLGRCLNYLIIAIIPICFGYAAISHDLVVALASSKYAEAGGFSPVILFASSLLGMNALLNAGLYLQKKSKVLLLIMLATLAVNVLANLVLLPGMGIQGAAAAKLVAAVASTWLTVSLSYRYLRVKAQVGTIVYYLAASGVMYFVLGAIDLHNAWLNLGAKLAVGTALIVPAILLREKEILEKLVQVKRGSGAPVADGDAAGRPAGAAEGSRGQR